MKLVKYIGIRLLAVALALTFVPAAVPSGTPLVGISKADAQSYNGRRYYRGGGGYYGGRRFDRGPRYYGGRRYDGGSRYYRDRYYGGRYRDRNAGAAVAAGIIGLGIGAALANSGPRYYEQPYGGRRYGGLSSRDRSCLARYRSYDVGSKTYQPYNGPRRICYG